MIYLLTGQPGHGKTLRGIQLARDFAKKGRTVYAARIRDLNHEKAGFQKLADFKAWMDLPDGSVILLDECYIDMPKRAAGAKVPAWVDELARHRHRGFDFIFICQSPTKQLDPFVHDLVEDHTHVRRKFGFAFANLMVWDKFQANVKAEPLRLIRWRYPKELFGLYTSTEMDTSQRRIPWYLWGAPVGVLIVLGYWYYIAHSWDVRAEEARPQASADPVTAARDGRPQRPARAAAPVYETREEYMAASVARVPGAPWTAPIFDGREVVAEPRLFCMASAPGRDGLGRRDPRGGCHCKTEQGTDYALDPRVCQSLARHGEVYNPYRKPAESEPAPVASVAGGVGVRPYANGSSESVEALPKVASIESPVADRAATPLPVNAVQ